MNILITGVSQGIGYKLACKFAACEGNHVIGISRSSEKLRKLVAEPVGSNSKITPLAYDINGVLEDAHDLTKKLSALVPHIDIMVNNAGYLINKPFPQFTFREALDVFNTNFFAAAFLIQQLKELVMRSEVRHIINISSMGGFQGSSKFSGLSFYSAAKAAIANLTECLAEEFKDDGISVNALAIGAVETEMLQKAFPGFQPPLKAAEMAEFIYDFACKGHKYFNGKILPVSTGSP